MRRLRRASGAIAAAGLLAVLALITACSAQDAGPGRRVLVVGDADATSAGDRSWPDLLEADGVDVRVDAVPDTDWLTASPRSVADRVAGASVDAVVIALGVDQPDAPTALVDAAIRGGIGAASAEGARVIVLLPIPAGGAWDEALRAQAGAAGAVFVDVSGVGGSLTDVGTHEAIARLVADALP